MNDMYLQFICYAANTIANSIASLEKTLLTIKLHEIDKSNEQKYKEILMQRLEHMNKPENNEQGFCQQTQGILNKK